MKSVLTILPIAVLGCTMTVAQGVQPVPVPDPSPHQATSTSESPPGQQSTGIVNGTIVDQSGAVVAGARVTLTQDPSLIREVTSGHDGQFSFAGVPAGTFNLSSTSTGLAVQTSTGFLHPGEIFTAPPIVMPVATALTEVQVGVRPVEIAEDEIKVEEKQRVLFAIPNFYVSYVPNAAPLDAKQKFKLAWKTAIDPFTVVMVAGAAGVEQAQNHFAGYGQGAEGYAKRFGAGYADTLAGTFIGSALLPSLLKQDPRYFYKGAGSVPSRFLYAIGNAVICKGDNGRWQANYSNILGNLAAGGLSNLYYPEQDRNGPALTFENGAIGIGTTGIANLFQEFIVRKLTPRLPKHKPNNP